MAPSCKITALFLCALALSGCSGNSNNTNGATGQASLVLTDMATDEIDLFEVDVTSVQLRRLSGATVSPLTKTTRVDFTELEDVGELVGSFSLPVGAYTGMTMKLDFSSATIYIKDKSAAATVVDEDGNTISGSVDVQVNFSNTSRPNIIVGKNHLFMLDLDLNQALTVDATNNRVTFAPVVRAEVDPTNPKPITTAGVLKSVDTTSQTFVVERQTPSGATVGEFTVRTSTSTIFQISGSVQSGSAGLAALAALTGTNKRVYAQGTLDADERILVAKSVEAGAGTFGNGQDWVSGLITARTGASGADPTLTVRGTSRDDSSNSRTFNTTHTVQLSRANSKVIRRGASNVVNTDALNVGQRVIVFGTLSGTVLDARATSGVCRMLKTSVFGTATAAPSGNTLTLNVSRIGLRPIGAFNFTVASNTEAVATTFKVNVTGLSTSGVTTGSKIRALGFVNPVGISADDNMTAASVVNRSAEAQLLVGRWSPATGDAISATSNSAVTLDVSAAQTKNVWDGFSNTVIQTSPAPTLAARANVGFYAIVKSGSVELHLGFAAFSSALATQKSNGSKVIKISALGKFDSTTQAFQANVITVLMK